MTSNRPYLIRAIYDWIIDNGMTPHLMVDAEHPSAVVPMEFADDGRIVLNVAPQAVHGFHIGNDMIRFSARFGGKPFAIELAPQAVLGLFARENGQGMLFPDEEPAAPEAEADADADADATAGTDNTSDDGDKKPSRPNLRIVK
ncbi:MAG: ClpXP protease specificity-enhancing factor [Thiohalocapsa sp.]|jgi:stringent starvation protein B|uniref:ClpXP protease specificity-enhancing factor n=1 Tax=Thiohalocapsa sp. TaxID=2497641 RepID=UPI0025CB7924|nr:ClpXP protease specificity-enhancing factor [Thiohalocapsa sp.]MCG6943392.1 ClpXP protease specificity-enhancing factor [Thiohalocapsa sp.]